MEELEEGLHGYEPFCQKEGPVFCGVFFRFSSLSLIDFRSLSTLYTRHWLYAPFQVIVGEELAGLKEAL